MSNFSLKQSVNYLLYALLLTPAIVFSGALFPYISARTVYFRSIIEIILIIFIILIWRQKINFSKQANYFFTIFSLFIAVNIISSLFSFSFSLAWFSDIERMWGVFTLLHLFLFYIFLRIFFQGEQWKLFLNLSIIVSLYVAGYGIVQYYPDVFGITLFQAGPGRIISTLGNSAYVAIYLVFNMFFALFLLLKTKNNSWRFFYALVIIINSFAFNLAGIRGTLLGLIIGVGAAALLYIMFGTEKKYKIILTFLIIISSGIIFFALQYPNNSWVAKSNFLSKIASINTGGGTTQTRLIGWRAAWDGFKEHPLFGVGEDNYNIIFNKYFDANYYLVAPSEPYFDRSHNAWLDVLVMNGLVGFVIFLGFPGLIFYYLLQGLRRQKIGLSEFLLFSALSVTYFTHLFFVFDDLNSYAYFVVLIAFIEYRYYKDSSLQFGDIRKQKDPVVSGLLLGGAILLLIIMYNFNIKVIQACATVVDAMQSQGSIEQTIAGFDKALTYDIVPSRNVVLSYANYITQQGGNLPNIINDVQQKSVFVAGLNNILLAMDKEINKDKSNAMLYNRRAVLYNISFLVSNNPKDIYVAVSDSQKAIELSREHLQYYYVLADSYMIAQETTKAVEAIKTSIAINAQYKPGYFNLLRIYLNNNELDKAFGIAKILARNNYNEGDASVFVSLAQNFNLANQPDKELATLELVWPNYKQDPNLASALIAVYLKNNNFDQAIAVAEALKEANHDLSMQVDYLINEIKAGRGDDILKQMTDN